MSQRSFPSNFQLFQKINIIEKMIELEFKFFFV